MTLCYVVPLQLYFPQSACSLTPGIPQLTAAAAILIMIGIQEDVLNMFLITHFLLLFSCGGLVFVFTLLLCLRMNPNFKSSLPRSGGWFGGQARRVQQQQPVYVEEPRQRRGWFQRN